MQWVNVAEILGWQGKLNVIKHLVLYVFHNQTTIIPLGKID
jgi:hypothetical protein